MDNDVVKIKAEPNIRKRQSSDLLENVAGPSAVKIRPATVKMNEEDIVITTVEKAAKLKVLYDFSDDQYDALAKSYPSIFPSLLDVMEYLQALSTQLAFKRESEGLAKSIISYVDSLPTGSFQGARVPSYSLDNVRVNFGIDAGHKSTKMVYYLPDLHNPHDLSKLRIYDCYEGEETRDNLKPYADAINAAASFLQQGPIKTKHGLKLFTCFFIADCKCGDIIFGIQGGNAKKPCLYCHIESKKWKKFADIKEKDLRTIENIMASAEAIEKRKTKSGSLSKKAERDLKKDNGSVFAVPMITNIPLTRVVPDAVHIIASVVNEILIYFFGKELPPTLSQKFEDIGVTKNYGKEYSVLNTKKILRYVTGITNTEGDDIKCLKKFAKVEAYAVARSLTEDEITAMETTLKDFFDLIDIEYPDLPGKKIKLHMLRHHVMPFVKEHKSWGIFSAQSLEDIHEIKAKLYLQIPEQGSETKKIRMDFFKNHQLLKNHFTNAFL